jgi:hypothetical protein
VGLDTYAGRTPVDFFDPELDPSTVDEDFGCTRRDLLAFWRARKRRERQGGGGVFHGNYFRGGIYLSLVEYVTGVWLERTWIPPELVREMAAAFDRVDPEATIRHLATTSRGRGLSASDVGDLQAFFGVCARRGLGLVGSW